MAQIATPAQASVLFVLNQRFEDAWADYYRLDDEGQPLIGIKPGEDGFSRKCYIDHALKELCAETDALRLAIMMQTPAKWEDALILAAHLHGLDPVYEDCTEQEKQAYRIGMDLLLDFMFGEIDFGSGRMMSETSRFVSRTRLTKAGKFDELDK